jgi:hypothetical protein
MKLPPPDPNSHFAKFVETGDRAHADADLAELQAHHAAHQERMARRAALEPKSDASVLAASIDRLAQAIEGNHAADVAAASAVAAGVHHVLSGAHQT